MDDPAQNRILLGFCVAPIASLAAFMVAVLFFADRLTGEAIALDVELVNLRPALIVIGVFVVLSAALTFFQALKHSQRIAGPVKRIRMSLAQIRAGDRLLRIRLRQGDYLTEVAEDINALLETLQAEATPSTGAPQPPRSGVAAADAGQPETALSVTGLE
jgi:methyl-accepting chemotaxis protein